MSLHTQFTSAQVAATRNLKQAAKQAKRLQRKDKRTHATI